MQETLEKQSKFGCKSKKIVNIDFNCDLAQGFGVYKNDKELDFLDYVTSVNVAAGFHSGDPLTIRNTLLAAKEKNLVIGANIGFNDLQGFGMRPMILSDEETEALVVYQVGALMSFAKAFGLEIEYVKPHGAMYKLASENFSFSCAIAKAIKKCSKWLYYVGEVGSSIEKVGEFLEIPIVREIELNKNFTVDGSVDYNMEDISNYDVLARRLQRYLTYSQVDNINKGTNFVEADSIHFSTDEVSLRLIKRGRELITPTPVNYGKVVNSGWV